MRFLFLIAAFLFFTAPLHSQETGSPKNLRVGVAGSPPFVIHRDSSYKGIAIEIWEKLAENGKQIYNFHYYPTMADGLKALKTHRVDLLVGPASITEERARHFQFTYPYYLSRLAILSKVKKTGFIDRLSAVFSKKLFASLGGLILVLGIVGLLLWLAERHHNPEQFPDKPGRGIANGMWCAITTMSTTGYGDRAPMTFWGRIVAGSWMVISIIFATTLVAGIASTLTLTGMNLSTINKAEDLTGKNVAVIENSPGLELTQKYHAKPWEVHDLEAAYKLLKKGEVAAVIYDRPQLLYLVKQKNDDTVTVSTHSYKPKGYGFVLPLNSPLTHEINLHMLHLKESGYIARILHYWLGETM